MTTEPDVPSAVDAIYFDSDSGLTWQVVVGSASSFLGSQLYCDGLQAAGSSDWRLPTIEDLRSLTRGCPELALTGTCNLSSGGCESMSCRDAACIEFCSGEEPDGACHWPMDVDGSCTAGAYWSSTSVADQAGDRWTIDLASGGLRFEAEHENALARCVAGP